MVRSSSVCGLVAGGVGGGVGGGGDSFFGGSTWKHFGGRPGKFLKHGRHGSFG